VTPVSKIETANLWEPTVLGRSKLDERWWAYLVEAPFDMPAGMPELLGKRVTLDGEPFGIGGTVPHVPAGEIREGDPIQLLVSAG
jgi:hypothetical protein